MSAEKNTGEKMRTVVVTGGTVRLGKVISDTLRERGWRVLTTSHRADSGADIICDLGVVGGAVECYSAALRLLDGEPPDALVNNAALYSGEEERVRLIGFESPKKLTTLMSTREDGVGSVVNILDALRDDPASSASSAYREAKSALADLTKTHAAMFVNTLRVNSVSPGPLAALNPTAVHEKAAECPLGRPTAAAVADAVAFLLENAFVTGVDVAVDGGARL